MLRECGRRNYQGVLLDFEEPPRADRQRFVRQLGEALSAGRRSLYIPASYGSCAENAVVLIHAAVSGGSFAEYLRETAATRGTPGRLALDLERLRMDFPLPAPTGQGEPLTAESLSRLLERESPAVFFSQELCARYFTYTRDGAHRFVLYDDAGTLRQKLRIGTALGYAACFFMWPEIQDIAADLLS